MIKAFIFLIYFLLLVAIFFNSKTHFISSLLILEAVVLVSLIISCFITSVVASSFSLWIVLLTLSVCEASLGLSLLVAMIKVKGSDLMKPYFLL
uniref:NADH dehydrogenase subunit 4L n=1 Tax=Megalophaedusa micropeas TaxID=1885765 RepID=A0A224ACY4_9EUPU|nr:NADH dehydrogenase subunit 4L [Megalophaedusa micropeas]